MNSQFCIYFYRLVPQHCISTKIQKYWVHPSFTVTISHYFLNLQTFYPSSLHASPAPNIHPHTWLPVADLVLPHMSQQMSVFSPQSLPAQTLTSFLLQGPWSLWTYHIPSVFKSVGTLFSLSVSGLFCHSSTFSNASLSHFMGSFLICRISASI